MAASKDETQQAFRSLIHSVTNADSNGPKSSLSPEAIDRLTERLSEIVGLDSAKDFTPRRNERGELVNEEGLPIIDITEPISGSETQEYVQVDLDPIVKLDQVSVTTRERLRQQRERMLDKLEAEEREEEANQKAKEREEYAELARKKAESSVDEHTRLKAAKEMQRRMGKALIRNMAESRSKEEIEKEAQRLKDEAEDTKKKATASKKKNVSFAPDVVSDDKEQDAAAWGDVVPATLKPSNRPTLLSQQQSDKSTMKTKVVERVPTSKRPPSPPPIQAEGDSDDESDIDTLLEDPEDTSELNPVGPPRSSASDESDVDDDELAEEIDLDVADMNRQIELEYHRKRQTIGQAAAIAMQGIAAQHEEPPQVKDDAGVSLSDPPKPAISQFRATKLASAYGAAHPSSAAIGDFVVPASTAKTIQKSLRTGKLDSEGNLIGGENDSDSEVEDEGMQEILELLKKGEVYNIGPNGEYIHTVPPKDIKPANPDANGTATSSALRLGDSSSTRILPPLATKTPTSKFKISRAAASRPSPNSEGLSPSPTPVNQLGRSSPKDTPPISPAGQPSQSKGPLNPPQIPNPMSMIVDSPSFPRQAIPTSSGAAAPPAFSMTVDSPSFPRTPGMNATPTANGPSRSSSRPDRPPTVLASTVRETKPATAGAAPSSESSSAPPRRVSRFKQERM